MLSARQRPTPLGRCACGAYVDAASFRDRQSYREWWIHPACQACQDATFLARDSSTGRRLVLRRGAIVVCRDRELAALPFLFTRPGGPRAWEPRFALHVGPAVRRSDPYADLAAMRSELNEHQISVHFARSWWQGAAYRLGSPDLIITADLPMAALCAQLVPALGRSCRLAIDDPSVLSPSLFRAVSRCVAPLFAAGPDVSDPSAGAIPSALACCASVGAVLAEPLAAGRSRARAVFDVVLEAHFARQRAGVRRPQP